jgi:hypothetical protein
MKTGRVCFWLSRAALLVVALIAQGVLSQNVTTYSLPAIECKRFTTAQGVFGCQCEWLFAVDVPTGVSPRPGALKKRAASSALTAEAKRAKT